MSAGESSRPAADRPAICGERGKEAGSEYEGEPSENRRQEREQWLGHWAQIWSKQRRPEWRPRRASVATCQRSRLTQYHDRQQLCEPLRGAIDDPLASYLDFDDFHKEDSLHRQQRRAHRSLTSDQADSIKTGQFNNGADDEQSEQIAREGDAHSSASMNAANRRESMEQRAEFEGLGSDMSGERRVGKDLQCSSASASSASSLVCSQGAHSAGKISKVGIFGARKVTSSLSRSALNSNLPSKMLIGSKSCESNRKKLQHRRQFTCCCSQLNKRLADESVVPATNQALQMQDRHRKYLIFSMAFRQMSLEARGCLASPTRSCKLGSESRPTKRQLGKQKSGAMTPTRRAGVVANSSHPMLIDRLAVGEYRAVTAPPTCCPDNEQVGASSAQPVADERSTVRISVREPVVEVSKVICEPSGGFFSDESRRLRTVDERVTMNTSPMKFQEQEVKSDERVSEHFSTDSSGNSSEFEANCESLPNFDSSGSNNNNSDHEMTRQRAHDQNCVMRPREDCCGGGCADLRASLRLEGDACESNLESLIVESWLDDHPDFVHDYFMRKANNQLIDDWLMAHAKVSNTSLTKELEQMGPDVLSRPVSQHSLLGSQQMQSPKMDQDSTLRAQTDQRQHQTSSNKGTGSNLRTSRSSSQSGAATPVRKISATDFETKTGNGFLRSMVSTTPDGKPTFLSQLSAVPSCCYDDDDDEIDRFEMSRRAMASDERVVKPSENEASGYIDLDANLKFGANKSQTERQESNELEEADDGTQNEEVKLIFELVKNICNDLDIRTLLHKILKNIAVLINADKSSLFLVYGEAGNPNRHLVSQLFNVDQDSEVSEPGDCITIPWGTGLVGYVAESGESLNIANCYDDPRFTNTVDKRTGYVTKHMLCAPIFDKRNEIVGVAQVINKRDGNPFSKSDELKFKRYLQFCGIGLRNAQSFEQCQLENKRNQVLLDLARMVFEEQSTIEQVVYRIMLHTQSLLECQRCQVLLIDDGSDDLDQLLQLPTSPRTARQHLGQRKLETTNVEPKPEWRPQCTSSSGQGVSGGCPSVDGYDSSDRLERQLSGDRERKQSEAMRQQQGVSPKLFSLVFDLERDGDDLVMHTSKELPEDQPSCLSAGNRKKNCRFPINIGITGYVAKTGETLNIEDAHQCDRFDPSVDEGSNFRHKSILCMPIRNGQRQIIGVSQLINKKNGRPFNKNDEDLFEAFAIFCGLGIHNTLMYEKVLKIVAKQRVTFEVLSYHATAPLEEAKKLNLEQIPSCFALNLTSLKFNDFSLDEKFMLKSCLRFFLDLDLIRRFQIDQLVFCNWILSVQKNYRKVTYHPIVGGNGLKASPVRYHNWRHAFNVSQMMFAILINTQICQALGELETLALLIACLCHDLDHRGTNNSFQIKSASPLAELYSTSTMEHHHFDQCVMILNSQGNQILANLSPEEYSRVIALLEEAILATDLANYFRKRERFFTLVNSHQFDWRNNTEHRSLLRCMLMTACDVAAITKPWPVQKVVADLVISEFYQQGDIEKHELNIEPIDMMNREKISKLPEMQIGFIDSICAPIYTAFAKLFPHELSPLLEGCLSNRDLWAEMAKNADIKLACYMNSNTSLISLPSDCAGSIRSRANSFLLERRLERAEPSSAKSSQATSKYRAELQTNLSPSCDQIGVKAGCPRRSV